MTSAGGLSVWAVVADGTRVGLRVFPGLIGVDLIAALGVCGRGLAGRSWLRCSGSGEGGGEVADQRRLGAGGGEGEADARHGLDDAGAELQQPEPQRGELSDGEGIRLRDGVAECQDLMNKTG